jgi:methylated-DNA-[protein]-cysteine S-methyltransferase
MLLFSTVRVRTPIGELAGYVHEGALCALEFVDGRHDARRELASRFGPAEVAEADPLELRARFNSYLTGDVRALDRIPVDAGGTPFQRAVWAALRRIPAGATVSYAALAGDIGAPTAVRAVGAANGRNPVPIVVPCHRVVRSDGSLGGYGGGLHVKRWLLDHERMHVGSVATASSQTGLFDG